MSEIGRKASNAVVAVVDFYASERAQLDAENERLKEIASKLARDGEEARQRVDELERECGRRLDRAERAEASIFKLTEKLRVAEVRGGRTIEAEAEEVETQLFVALCKHGLISMESSFGLRRLVACTIDSLAKLDDEAAALYRTLKQHKIRVKRWPRRLPPVNVSKG